MRGYDINANGYNVSKGDPVKVIEIPDGTKIIVDGHHRVEAMEKLGESYIPIEYYKYNELIISPDKRLMQREIEALFFVLNIGKRTGYYKGSWLPDLSSWAGDTYIQSLIYRVDYFMSSEFPSFKKK